MALIVTFMYIRSSSFLSQYNAIKLQIEANILTKVMYVSSLVHLILGWMCKGSCRCLCVFIILYMQNSFSILHFHLHQCFLLNFL